MFDDAQEVEDNIQACVKFEEQSHREQLDPEERDSKHEKDVANLKPEQRVENMMHFLEVFDVDDFLKNHIPLDKQECVDSTLDLSYDTQEVDHFMYAPLDHHESKSANHFTQEQIDFPSIFLFDDIPESLGEPRYDEYNDEYEVVFSEQGVTDFQPEIVHSQQ